MRAMKTISATPVAQAVTWVLLGLLAPAHAQVQASDTAEDAAPVLSPGSKKPTDKLETVVITSSKRSQAAHKVPYNVSALTQDQLREANIGDAKKLIAENVSINAPGNSARFADSVSVRGLNVSNVNANNLEQFVRTTVAYYLDDTPLPHMGYRIKDVARVETLLGPQGTLYGAGSLGGTIRYITNKPDTRGFDAKLNTSFYQTRHGGLSNDSDLMLNAPLGEQLALRVSLAKLDEKGYTDRLANRPWITDPKLAWDGRPDAATLLYPRDDWQRVKGGRLSLLFKPTADVELLLAHAEQSMLAHGSNGANTLPVKVAQAQTPGSSYDSTWDTPFVVNDHTLISRYPEYADRDFKLDSLDLDWNLGFARLHASSSRFSDARVGQGDYAANGNSYYGWITGLGLGDSKRSAFMSFDNRYSGHSHELRLVSNSSGPWNWLLGLYRTGQDKNLRFSEWLPGLDAVGFPVLQSWYPALTWTRAAVGGRVDEGYAEDMQSRYRETAAYGELSFKPTERWTLTAGARVFNYEDRATPLVRDYIGSTSRAGEFTDSGKGKAYFKLNSAYQLSADLLGYATLSQGFRRGGSNGFRDDVDSFAGTVKAVNPEVKNYLPDTTTNVELGVKGFALERRLQLQADVYRIKWKNTQTDFSQSLEDHNPDSPNFGIGFPINGTANGPDAHTQGIEFAARYLLNEHWQFSLNSAYTKAEWDQTKTLCAYADGSGCTTWSAGGALGGAPAWKHTAGLRYSRSLDNGMEFSAALNARRVGAVLSSRHDDPKEAAPHAYPAYTLLNANMGLSWDHWDLNLWVQNLRDVRAVTSYQAVGDSQLGRRLITTQPRTVGLNLGYSFK